MTSEWKQHKPIAVEDISDKKEIDDETMRFFITVAQDAGYSLYRQRTFDCPYKSDQPCYSIVLKHGGDRIEIGASIHAYQFFVTIQGFFYRSMLYPTAYYSIRSEYVAVLGEFYPWLASSSDSIKRFKSKLYNWTPKRAIPPFFFQQRRRVQIIKQLIIAIALSRATHKQKVLKRKPIMKRY